MLLLSLSSLAFGAVDQQKRTTMDPGVINEESILYWLVKRGELSTTATDLEKRAALKHYLRGSERGAYHLPKALVDKKRAVEKQLNLRKSSDRRLQSSPGKESLSQSAQSQNAVNTTVKVLAILVDFPDLPYNDNQLTTTDTDMYYADYNVAHYRDLIFSTTGYAGPSGQNLMSVYQYYQQVSGNTFFMEGDAFGWVTATNPAAFYGARSEDDEDNDVDVAALVKEAVEKAVALGGINLAEYDLEDPYDQNNNGITDEPDGIIDHVMIYHSSIGEEAGGGVLGDDAIWSHRSGVDYDTDGYTIPGTNFAVRGYTIEPLDSAIGVVAHEFGHDLGVADEYNVGSNEVTDRSPVGYWSLMASGSWSGTPAGSEPTGFSPLASNYFQKKFDGDWIDKTTYTLQELTNPQTLTLTEAVNHDSATNMIEVEVPDSLIDFFPPFTGSYQYHSGAGDRKNNTMSFQLDVPTAGTVELKMKAHWNIEVDYDYARLMINGVALAGNQTKETNPLQFGITNYLTGISANIAGATGTEGWVELVFDMAIFMGQTVTVTIEYITDPFVGDYGLVIDDIDLVADNASVFFDGAEMTPGPTFSGFKRIQSKRDGPNEKRYWVQMRSFNDVDIGVSAQGMQRGMLVWFEDNTYDDNQVQLHPGHSLIGVIDAGQVIQSNGAGDPYSATVQISDATFSLNESAETSSEFNDSNDYSSPEQPGAGMLLPRNGLNIALDTQAADSSSASVILSVGQVPWQAVFSHSKVFRTVTLANDSDGTGNASASWNFGDGSALSSEWTPTHVYATSGDFTVTLTITTDADGSTSSISQSVSIAELLVPSYQATDDNGTVSFSATTTGGESVITYSWDFGDGSAAVMGANVSHAYDISDNYMVMVSVASADGQTATLTKAVQVNILPVAAFSSAINYLEVTFTDATTGGDANNSYAWTFGDGGTSTEASPVYTYTADGTYTVELTVTDSVANTNMVSTSVTVAAAPLPVAGFTFTTTDLTARFIDTSTGGAGSLAYAWDFGDGTSSVTASPSKGYVAAGNYTVQLVITDEQSNTDTFSASVTVTAPPAPAPKSGGGGSSGFILLGLMMLYGRFKKQ